MKLVISLIFTIFLLLGAIVYIYITTNNNELIPNLVIRDENKTTSPFEEEIEFKKEKFESNWDNIESSLINATEIYSKILQLQDNEDISMIDKLFNKEGSLRKDLNAIFDELIEDYLRDSRIEDYQYNIKDIEDYIIDLKLSIKDNEDMLVDAPSKAWFSSTKDDYKEKINDLKNEIKEYQTNIKDINNSIRAYIKALGLNISNYRIDILLKRVDFINMLDILLVIDMSDMTMDRLNKSISKDKLDEVIKYYNINQVLFELVIYQSNKYIKDINSYIDKLGELNRENRRLYQLDMSKFKKEKSRIKRKIYKNSMKALKLFEKALILYKNDLSKQKIRLLKIIYISSSNLEASKSEYKVSKYSLETLTPIRNMKREFKKMIKVFLDIKVRFKTIKIKNKYIEITDKLK
ncbi:DNA double-strand break repair Rad50 ATPase [hydrothermal vent metagenome]|uniref:DNA double-strand break repair Rad50 ATPase n=1 Tax=hydrothermal vent metagenome TaxID=652676 RepID=A0A1W1EHM8_9ZZZZ